MQLGVTHEEVVDYFNVVAAYNIKSEVSILSLSRKRVFRAVFRGAQVFEHLEFSVHSGEIAWKVRKDENGHYSWVPEMWHGKPGREKLQTKDLAGLYQPGDVLDATTLRIIEYRRTKNHEETRAVVGSILNSVHDQLLRVNNRAVGPTWPSLCVVGMWNKAVVEDDAIPVPCVEDALLVRAWAEGYQPLADQACRGGSMTDEQCSWANGEDAACSQDVLYYAILSLRAAYLKHVGMLL